MIKKIFLKTRKDGVKLYRIYSDTTPKIKQHPTNIVYDCWVYKMDEKGNQTTEIDWENSGVVDVENAPYTYSEVYGE